jgi:hypothetical protein
MNFFFIFLIYSPYSLSQVTIRPRVGRSGVLAREIKSPKKKSHTKTFDPPEVDGLNQTNAKLDQFIEKFKDKPAIWDFSLIYDFKTATVLKARLLNSIVSTNLESPLVVEIYGDQGLPVGSTMSCLGMTKYKRVIAGCSRLITPGSAGDEYEVEVSLLNPDGTAGLTGEYYSGKELYVAGMIASAFARGSIELSQSRLATAAGELKLNSAKNRYLEGILNSADEGADLMKKEMQTTEPKVFIKAGKEVLVFFNRRFKL